MMSPDLGRVQERTCSDEKESVDAKNKHGSLSFPSKRERQKFNTCIKHDEVIEVQGPNILKALFYR